MNNIIVYDCETGGLKWKENPITQIALIAVDGTTFKELKSYETFVKPYDNLKIKQEALNNSMLSMSDIMRGIDVKVLYKTLVSFFDSMKKGTEKPVLAGHNNAEFDNDFLVYVFNKFEDNLYDHVSKYTIDTLVECKRKWSGQLKSDEVSRMKLSMCCGRYGIKLIDAHGAMADAKATKELLHRLTKDLRKESSDEAGEAESTEENKIPSRAEKSHYQF